MRSAMTVPMVARSGHARGDSPSSPGRPGRRFDKRDLELAEELGAPLRAPRSTTPASTASAPTSRARCRRACCRPSCPTSRASRRPRASGPTGEGNEMGGDFYDLFASGGRGWTVVMGDVCGKGPDAAAVTALARYTLRAAAMRERLPEPRPPRAERGAAAPAHRPPLLHRRLRLPRVGRERRPARVRQRRAPAAPAPAPRRRRGGGGRARHAARAWCPTRPSRTAPWSSPRATRSSSTPTA